MNNLKLHEFKTQDFNTLFPAYKELKKLFRLKDANLQRVILCLGDSDFYSVYITFDKKMTLHLSKDSQGFKSLLRYLILNRNPELQKYEVQVYDLNEFYIHIKDFKESLYVPVKPYCSREFDKVLERTISYHNSYYLFTRQALPDWKLFTASEDIINIKRIINGN